MAGATRKRKEELIRALDACRTVLTVDGGEVKHEVQRKANLPGQFHRSVQDHTLRWVGGALLAGFLFGRISPSLRRRRKKKKQKQKEDSDAEEVVKKGLMATAFGTLVTTGISIARPTLTRVLRKKAETLLKEKLGLQD